MTQKVLAILVAGLLIGPGPAQAKVIADKADAPSQHFLSTSLFMAVNLIPLEEPPHFFQLNYGYRITPKDVLTVEVITWRYHAPLGIPYGPSKGDLDESFAGYAHDIGVGLGYQRFLWRGAYTALHVTPFLQNYHDEDGDYIQSGFQLFMTLRFGYHFDLWGDRLFLEPSVAFTAWPINTNLPDDFQRLEDKWPSYFLFEPGLTLGFNL